MYARVISTNIMTSKVDEAISTWRDKIAPNVKQAKGFKGAYLVGDRASGKSLTITLWESKEDADALNTSLPQNLAFFEGMFTSQPSVETYEVFVQV